jgi:sugar phosphate isomerase/epimerase
MQERSAQEGPAKRIDRRGFLAAVGGAAGFALAGPLAASRLVGGPGGSRSGPAAPGPVPLEPVGLQLYTVRSLMERDVPRTLQRVADVGYREVEFAGYYDHEPERLRGILDRLGLSAPSAHVSLETMEGDGAASAIRAAQALGHRWLVVPWLPPEQRQTLDDYRRVAASLEEIGARVNDAGLRLAYHNHDFELEPIDGTLPYTILADTEPDRVALQLDLYWVRAAGSDALTWFRRHPGRFPSVHVKDMATDGEMVDVGSGVIDWADVLGKARAAGVEHLFVEHDQPGDDPIASVRNSFQYLHRLSV